MQPIDYVKKYAVVIVAFAAFVTYSPVLSAPFFSVDDYTIISHTVPQADNITPDTISRLFRRDSIERYYRPLLLLSFILDGKIWSYNSAGYHLTNLTIHCLSSIILYFIFIEFLIKISGCSNPTDSYPGHFKIWAMASALLFAVHPITCESVAWISGKSDVLATFFCLIAFYCYLSGFRGSRILCAACFLAGLFSKESALALFPTIIIVHTFFLLKSGENKNKILKSVFGWVVTLSVPLLIYTYLRMDGLNALDHGVKTALSNDVTTEATGFHFGVLKYLAAAISFYFKKLFIPIPLNFAIIEINVNLYSTIFLIVLSVAVFLFLKKEWLFLVWSTLLIVSFAPSLLVATSKMAWTPLAERYVYLSAAVWSFLPVLILHRINNNKLKIYILSITFATIILFFFTTMSRAILWNDNIELWADTYKKNPQSAKVLYHYGYSLGIDEGVPYFRRALEVGPDDEATALSLLALAKNSLNNGNYEQAIDFVNRSTSIPENLATNDVKNAYSGAVEILKSIQNMEFQNKEEIYKKLIYSYESAYQKQKNAVSLYQISVLYSRLGDIEKERIYLTKILDEFPNSSHTNIARTRLEEIHSGNTGV